MSIPNKNKIYFASDVHLGANYIKDQKTHQALFVSWLDEIKKDAKALFLLGDIFDFWYEYKRVIPRGYTKVLGKLMELCEAGIEVHFFIGNHDIWTFGYLENEIGMQVHYQPQCIELDGKTYFLAHGDGLGDPDKVFSLLRKVFRSRWAQSLFSTFIHPNLAMKFGLWWSGHSRKETEKENQYLGEDKEHLILFAKDYIKNTDSPPAYFIFGHRHIVLDLQIQSNSRVLILGDWISNFSYAVWDKQQLRLEHFYNK